MMIDEIAVRLAEPFHPKRVHWRIGSTWERDGKVFGKPLAYIDARDVMERLDDVVGPDRWQDSYKETPSGRIICSLSIFIDPVHLQPYQDGGWITKSDGAGDTGFEGEKGAISDALKRAGVRWGIGRYLYAIDSGPVELEVKGKSKFLPRSWVEQVAPKLLPTYKPSIYRDWRKFTDAVLENTDSILKMKQWLAEGDTEPAKAEWLAISNEEKSDMNRPWTRGGIWTPDETKQMKNW